MLDFLNAARVRVGDGRATRRREGEFEIEEARSLTPDRRRVLKRVRVSGVASGRELARYEERVTLFGKEELAALLRGAGLLPLDFLGDYRGEPFRVDSSPRLIIVARKA